MDQPASFVRLTMDLLSEIDAKRKLDDDRERQEMEAMMAELRSR